MSRGYLKTASLVTVLLCSVCACVAQAYDLSGVVLSPVDSTPVPGVRVVLEGQTRAVVTDPDGRFWFGDVDRADLVVVDAAGRALRWVDQRSDRPSVLRAPWPSNVDAGHMAFGGPLASGPVRVSPAPVHIPPPVANPHGAVIGTELPATIRVGRRFASSCAGNPVQRIDEVPFEEYVEGVLVPEIGVFMRIAGGPDSSREVFRALAIAARSYAYHFYLTNPDAEFHIDDTACNQRYDDARDPFVAEAVASTAGLIMVADHDPALLDRIEYAASCGGHGSRPEYQDALVPDDTGVTACVGSWCGHTTCAGHEVNPAVPDEGRCLVRGICQWGAAERSMRGDTGEDILAHYQPNLRIVRVGAPVPARVVGFVRVGDVFEGPGVAGVSVGADSGASARTDARGYFTLTPVTPGERLITYAGAGIVPAEQRRVVAESGTTWASVAVTLASDDPDPGLDAGSGADIGAVDASAGQDIGDDAPAADAMLPDVPSPDVVSPDSSNPGEADASADASQPAVETDERPAPSSKAPERGCSASPGPATSSALFAFAFLCIWRRR